jgi:hypothetical protein
MGVASGQRPLRPWTQSTALASWTYANPAVRVPLNIVRPTVFGGTEGGFASFWSGVALPALLCWSPRWACVAGFELRAALAMKTRPARPGGGVAAGGEEELGEKIWQSADPLSARVPGRWRDVAWLGRLVTGTLDCNSAEGFASDPPVGGVGCVVVCIERDAAKPRVKPTAMASTPGHGIDRIWGGHAGRRAERPRRASVAERRAACA